MVEKEESINICKRCHRKLKDAESKKLGFGPICYKKYLETKKIYLFEMEEKINMFTHEDLVKFYQLYMHYDLSSPNIGVIDKDKFNKLLKLVKKENKNNVNAKIILNPESTKLTIIEDEIETSYILIQNYDDMVRKYFRKYI